MSDASMAAAGRTLARALVRRAHSRDAEDSKAVLRAQTDLVSEYGAEMDAEAEAEAQKSEPQP